MGAGGAEGGGGGGGAVVEGFREVIGGGGGLLPGNGGGALGGVTSLEDCVDLRGISDIGRLTGFSGGCRSFATMGF